MRYYLLLLKVNSDKPSLTFHRWKCKTGKKLTTAANSWERNVGTVGTKSSPWAVS